jgi:hypothetical protein
MELWAKANRKIYLVTRTYVYGADPEVIRELKRRIGEYLEYHEFTEGQIWALRNNSWQIIPVLLPYMLSNKSPLLL